MFFSKFMFLAFFIQISFLNAALSAQAFQLGEKLTYKIQWGFLTVGHSVLTIHPELVEFNGVNCMVFKTSAKSEGFAAKMNPIDDKLISYYDPIKNRSMSTAKRVNEGRLHREYYAEFDFTHYVANWWQKVFKGNAPTDENQSWRSGKTTDIPENLLDALSAIYFTRNHPEPPETGKEFSMDVYDDLELVKMQMSIMQEEDLELNVNGQNQKFKTFVVRPYMPTSGVFKSEGHILIWISNDKRRIPLKIVSKIKYFGEVTVELESAEGLVDE
jgi:hypothetical protein